MTGARAGLVTPAPAEQAPFTQPPASTTRTALLNRRVRRWLLTGLCREAGEALTGLAHNRVPFLLAGKLSFQKWPGYLII